MMVRLHKRLLAIAGALFSILFLLAAAVPAVMDWDWLRPTLEAEASRATGRKVAIAGPIAPRLLPSPSIGLADVTVDGAPLIHFNRIRVGIAVLPLLHRRIEATDAMLGGGSAGALRDIDGRFSLGQGISAHGTARLPWGWATFDAQGGAGPGAPLKASLTLAQAGAALTFDGRGQAQGWRGRLHLDAASLRRLGGPDSSLPDQPVTADATLAASAEEIALQDLSLAFGASRMDGSIVANLVARPIQIDASLRAERIDLDGAPPLPVAEASPAPPVAAATPPAAIVGAAAEPETATTFALPANLAVNLDLAADHVVWRGGEIRRVQLSALMDNGTVSLGHASAEFPGATFASLTGTLFADNGQAVFDGSMRAATDALPSLRAWLMPGGPGGGPRTAILTAKVNSRDRTVGFRRVALSLDDVRAEGEAAFTLSAPLSISAKLAAQGLETSFDGSIAGSHVAGTVGLRAASFAQAVRLVAPAYRPRGAGALSLSTHVESSDGAIIFDQLQAKAGEAILNGQGRVVITGRHAITATLAGNALALDPFLPVERKAALTTPIRVGGAPLPQPAIILAATRADGSSWSRTPLDLGGWDGFDADISLSAPSISLQGWRLDQASAHLALTQGRAELDRLTGRLLGGELAAAGRLNTGGLTGTASLKGAEIGTLGLGAGGLKAIRGRFDAHTRLSAVGRSPADLIASLSGDGRFEVKDGVVEGFDLAAMDAQMRRLDSIANLLGLIQAGLSKGQSRFSTLSGTLKAERGIVTSQDLRLDAEGGGATGIATLDLPREQIDARIKFSLASPGSPALGLRLNGPLTSPNKAIDVNDLQRYLVEHGLGKALKGKGAQDDSPDAPAPKIKTGDVLRGLLSGFGKKKE